MKQPWISNTVICLTFLALFACSSGVRQRGDVYPGNQPKERWTEAKDSTRSFVRDGKYISWYESGEERTTGEYRNGLKTGLWITKYKSGQVLEWQDYVAGELHGLSVSYYENRNKKHEGKYSHNLRYGIWRFWHENDMLKEETLYKDGRKHGLSKSWFETGQKKESKEEGEAPTESPK